MTGTCGTNVAEAFRKDVALNIDEILIEMFSDEESESGESENDEAN